MTTKKKKSKDYSVAGTATTSPTSGGGTKTVSMTGKVTYRDSSGNKVSAPAGGGGGGSSPGGSSAAPAQTSSSGKTDQVSANMTAGDIVLQARKIAAETGANEWDVMSQIANSVVSMQKSSGSSSSGSASQDQRLTQDVADTSGQLGANLNLNPQSVMPQEGLSIAQQTLDPHNNPYMRAILPYTMGDMTDIKNMDESQLKNIQDFISGSALSVAGGQLLSGVMNWGKAGTILKGSNEKMIIDSIQKGSNIKINAKTVILAGQAVKKGLSARTLLAVGGTIAAAASTMFLGLWAQAEAPEPLSIAMRDVLREAQTTGNWTLYEEAAAARNEILELDGWEKIGIYSPLSPVIGIPNKIKGAVESAQVMDKLASDMKIKEQTGEDEITYWERVNAEKAQQEIEIIDYYNEQRKLLVQWENEEKAKANAEERQKNRDQRNDDANFWRLQREAMYKLEEEERERIAKFWMEYKKQALKLQAESRGSSLSFGLLR